MQVRVLGEVDVVADDAPVRVSSRNQRLVLALLAAQPGVAVSADLLIDALWGDDPPASARATLRTYVSRLRQLLGDRLTIGPTGYALDLPCVDLDICQFEQLVEQATEPMRPTDPSTTLKLLDEALSLWRGPPFGDVADLGPSLRGVATRLEECHVSACERRAATLLAAGRAADAVGAAEQLVADQPLREGAWAVLVEALADAQRVPEALRAYQRAVHALADAGLEPSEQLRRAESVALSRQQPTVGPRRLTVASSSLVGRDADVEAVVRLLTDHRIVTLVGPGGVGKTRLALAVATEVAARFEWGARLVELAPVAHRGAVPSVVVQSLGLAAHAEGPETVLAKAGQLEMLAIVDNCEHVVEAAAGAVELLASGGSRMRLLCTSREALGVDGEQRWPVSPLPAGITTLDGDAGLASPGDARAPSAAWSAAHQLFVERACMVRPDFDPDLREREAIDLVTRRLDGLPLAIEMAATRVATMPVVELANHIADEVGVVTSRRRNVEPRHRTLTAVVEWSEQLLGDDERAMFADMAIFEGSVRPEDVAAVTGRADSADLLARLAERSLLVVDTSGDRARFGMLRTVRDRARRRLEGTGRADQLATQHAEHVAAELIQADARLRGPDELHACDRIEDLFTEARSARKWAAAHDPATAQRICGALLLFGQSRHRDEVLGWSSELARELDGMVDTSHGALVSAAAAQQALNRGDVVAAGDLAERGLQVASRRTTPAYAVAEAMAYEIISDLHLFAGRLDDAGATGQAGLAAARRAGDLHCMTACLVNMAIAAAYGGHQDEAERLLAEAPGGSSLAPSDQAWLCYARGEVVLDRDPPRALASLDEAIALADSVDNRYVSGVARISATSLRARAGDPEAELEPFASVINRWRGQGNIPFQVTTLRNLVVLFHRLGAAPEVLHLLGATQGESLPPSYGDEAHRLREAQEWAVTQVGEVEAAQLQAEGAQRSIEEAALAALEWITGG